MAPHDSYQNKYFWYRGRFWWDKKILASYFFFHCWEYGLQTVCQLILAECSAEGSKLQLWKLFGHQRTVSRKCVCCMNHIVTTSARPWHSSTYLICFLVICLKKKKGHFITKSHFGGKTVVTAVLKLSDSLKCGLSFSGGIFLHQKSYDADRLDFNVFLHFFACYPTSWLVKLYIFYTRPFPLCLCQSVVCIFLKKTENIEMAGPAKKGTTGRVSLSVDTFGIGTCRS